MHGRHDKFLIMILLSYYSNDLLFAIYNVCPQRKFIISHRSGHQYWYRIYLEFGLWNYPCDVVILSYNLKL